MQDRFKIIQSLPLALVLVASFLNGCGKSKNDKGQQPQSCGSNLVSGQESTATLYTKPRSTYGESCESLAFTTKGTCENGKPTYLVGGHESCETAKLTKLLIVSQSPSLEIGQSLGLKLQGSDQWGNAFDIENAAAEWTSSDASVSVSNGTVKAMGKAVDVAVKASVDGVESNILKISTKSDKETCERVPNGGRKAVLRYTANKVPFGKVCALSEVTATCASGNLILEDGPWFESCEVAKLKYLTADPMSAYLKKNSQINVKLTLVDELETKIKVNSSKVAWTSNSDTVKAQNGTISTTANLVTAVPVTATYENFTTQIIVTNPSALPESISFKKQTYLLKQGDEADISVVGVINGKTVSIDPKLVTWESNNATNISVRDGKITATGSKQTAQIIGKIGSVSASAYVEVEAPLDISVQNLKNAVISEEKLAIKPALTATVSGPLLDDQPVLGTSNEGCTFTLHKAQTHWEIDVELNPTLGSIPGECTVDINGSSKAGQKINKKMIVPINYQQIDYREMAIPKDAIGSIEVARLAYRFSENLSIANFGIKFFENEGISPATCKLSITQSDSALVVTSDATNGVPELCAAYIFINLKAKGADKLVNIYELVTASDQKTFLEHCENPDNAQIENTVRAIKKAVAPTADCGKLDKLIREKNLYSAASTDSTFSISLGSENITSLDPLARFVGLRELVLANNKKLVDISPLLGLKSLNLLDLKGTKVEDFSPLFSHALMNDLRVPVGTRIACTDKTTNPEITKLCN